MTESNQTALRAFLSAAARGPSTVGAIAPSSPALAQALASVVPSTGTPTVVELGPGTGPASTAIQARLPRAGTHLAIELDAQLVDYLAKTQPNVDVVHGDAGALPQVLEQRGVSSVDAVISGLPWSLFSADEQHRILDSVGSALAPGGVFTTFGYVHAAALRGARRFHSVLLERFDEVLSSKVVWRNMPPARTFVCRRPLDTA